MSRENLRSNSGEPCLSIIISTLNAGRTLARCLDSLAGQEFADFEVIIIDGGSEDDTAAVAARYGRLIHHFQSEPDRGIYDAWNKALPLARGQWLAFLGADDRYMTAESLTQFADHAAYPNLNLITAKVDMTDSDGVLVRTTGEAWTNKRMKQYMCVAHPGAWHHRSLFITFGNFSLKYRLAGDYEFLLRASAAIRSHFVDQSLVIMQLGGISNRSYWRHVLENSKILWRHSRAGFLYALRFLARASIGKMLRYLGLRSNGNH